MISRWFVLVFSVCAVNFLAAQEPADDPAISIAPTLNEDRIFGILPNYATVNDTAHSVKPLSVKEKWALAFRESVDPFNVANAALGAGLSQWGNETPRYGEGGANYARRVGAAFGDFTTQNFFSAGLLASLLHQDPRYYRMGPEHSVVKRLGYSVSRIVIARQDSGAKAFNMSGVGGMALGIAASNLYYPSASIRWEVMSGRLLTSVTGSLIGNLTSEFWPDLHRVLHRHRFPLT